MKKSVLFTLSVAALLMAGTSCKKKCSIPEEDTDSGVIVESVIYPNSGGMIIPDGLHVSSSSTVQQQESFKISFDGGITQQSVDYSQYNILGYPLAVECDVAIDREVIFDSLNSLVLFNVTVHNCDNGCDELRAVENYVLVPAFDPAAWNIVYTVTEN